MQQESRRPEAASADHAPGARGSLARTLAPIAWGAWIAALAAPALAQDAGPEPDAVAFVEAASERGEAFAGTSVAVRVRFGFEETFLANALVQPFRRELDVPAQLLAEWLQVTDEDGEGLEIAIKDGVGTVLDSGILEREGRRFRAFELERAVPAGEPGTLVLEAPVLRFAYATAFDDDLLRGRVARDRRTAEVRGQAVHVRVLPLPEEGRPDGFAGAIGRFTLRAAAAPTALAAGETVRLELTIEGDGDLDAFPAPGLPPGSGLHELGRLERRDPGRRVVVVDLVPRDAGVRAVPALELPHFDPTPPGRWAVARSEPIPLAVAPADEETAPPAGPDPEPAAPRGGAPAGAWVAAGAAAALALALGARILRSKRG